MTSIAYRAEPPRPGWGWAIGSLLVGWILAGTAAFLLYTRAALVGAIGHSSALDGSAHADGLAAVYGLLHPLWAIDVIRPGTARPTTTIVMHNAALFPVKVESFSVSPPLGRLEGATHPFSFPARSDRFLVQRVPSEGCGKLVVQVHVRYRVFGLPLGQKVPAFVSFGRC